LASSRASRLRLTNRKSKSLLKQHLLARSWHGPFAYDKRLPGAEVWPGTHWEYANLVELNQEAEAYAQLDERGSWFYEAIGNSTGMQGRVLGFGQAYLETSKDKDGDWLSGDDNYRLRVPSNVPIRQFWSITLYDNVTRGPVITDKERPISPRVNRILSPMPTVRWMSILVRPSPRGKGTGSRLPRAKAGSRISASTHQRKLTSIRRGRCPISRK